MRAMRPASQRLKDNVTTPQAATIAGMASTSTRANSRADIE
jgi:pyrroline-5-carboxylate reductase